MVAAGLGIEMEVETELKIKVWPVLFTVPMRNSGPLAGYSLGHHGTSFPQALHHPKELDVSTVDFGNLVSSVH